MSQSATNMGVESGCLNSGSGSPQAARRHLMVGELSAARTRLLEEVIGLEPATLAEPTVEAGWSAKDVLAHLAAWDEIYVQRLELILAGREGEVRSYEPEDLDERNAELLQERCDWSLSKVMTFLLDRRRSYLAAFAQVPDADLERSLLGQGEETVVNWTRRRAIHDSTHARQLRDWRLALDLPWHGGPRARLLAHLDIERANLLAQLVHLPEETLSHTPIMPVQPGQAPWTAKDLLAHVAAWDRWELGAMQDLLAARPPDEVTLEQLHAYNEATLAPWRNHSLDEVLAELAEARVAWLAWLQAIPGDEFFRERRIDSEDWSFSACMQIQWRHDAEHAGHIAAWRKDTQPPRIPGPKSVLQAALRAARRALLSAASLVPPEARTKTPLVGEWTLRDLLGHLMDWEAWVLTAVRQIGAGQSPQVAAFESIQDWNEAHAAARRDQPWSQVWQEFIRTRAALDETVEKMSQETMERRHPAPWAEREVPAYLWLSLIVLDHELEHAHDLIGSVGH